MTLTIGVDTYISVEDATAYFYKRLHSSVWLAATDPYRETALLMACRAIDREDFRGTLATLTQVMAWPRAGVVNKDGREIGLSVVPQSVKDAQCELALTYLADDPNQDDGTAGVRRVVAGEVAIEYDGRAPVRRLPDAVLRLLRPFLVPGAGSASCLLVP